MSYLDLYDYRRHVAVMYEIRNLALLAGEDWEDVLARFRHERDKLFAHHSQSALAPADRATFRGLSYYPYNREARVEGRLEVVANGRRHDVETSADGIIPMRHTADVHFSLGGKDLSLAVYWIEVYGGGLFLPFRDATAPQETYGGGRYLVDTIKGSTFPRLERGESAWRVVLDFNYAYNPSCAYDARWSCPLAPPENDLAVPIRAGERVPSLHMHP